MAQLMKQMQQKGACCAATHAHHHQGLNHLGLKRDKEVSSFASLACEACKHVRRGWTSQLSALQLILMPQGSKA